jgi:hypothetical protein
MSKPKPKKEEENLDSGSDTETESEEEEDTVSCFRESIVSNYRDIFFFDAVFECRD